MKLSDYAKKTGISYRTAWQWYKDGKLKGYQAETGTIIIDDQPVETKPTKIAIYARVSSSENKSNLDSQADRLVAYCVAKGWQVAHVVKEIGSGVNDNRPKFLDLLADTSITLIVVEHKDRVTRFGFNYISTLLTTQGRQLEVVNLAENGKEDLMQDLVSIIYSFSVRMYGQRRAKRAWKATAEIIVKALQDQNDAAS
jgi:putative resolvase